MNNRQTIARPYPTYLRFFDLGEFSQLLHGNDHWLLLLAIVLFPLPFIISFNALHWTLKPSQISQFILRQAVHQSL